MTPPKLRRASDTRIDDLTQRAVRVETKVETLSAQMSDVFGNIGEVKEKCAKLEATDDHHTVMLGSISDKLDVLVSAHTASTAIENDRIETIKNITYYLKWCAGILLGFTGLGGAWVAFKAWLNG